LKHWLIDVLHLSRDEEQTSNLFINQLKITWLGRIDNLYLTPMNIMGMVRLRLIVSII
jgi:hypothetical protein